MAGAGMGMGGALLAATAITAGTFWFFVCSMTLLGAASAFTQQYRFAAADASPTEFKARAIAYVMIGGIITGVLGPQVSVHARGLIPGAPFAGPYLVLAVLFAIAAVILSRLVVPAPAPPQGGADRTRPLLTVLLQPAFLVALLVSVASYAPMVFVMTATPLAMIAHNHTQSNAQLGIQWHVIAMYGPSFFTGWLIQRFGKATIAIVGMLLIGAAATLALSGTGLPQFWGTLILLGMGWNFGFIAATTMVANLYRPEEAFRVQAMNEFILFGIVAVASFSSGGLLATGGWRVINGMVYPIVAVGIALIAAQAFMERRSAATTHS